MPVDDRLFLLTEDISRAALSWFELYHLSHGVGFLDSLIGATAANHSLTIATLNSKHFASLPGLQIERPYSKSTARGSIRGDGTYALVVQAK
jgi:predicted nucleic acid-binding protein